MPEPSYPLTEEDFAQLKEQLAKLEEAERIIERAQRGGIDMTDQRKQTTEIRTKLNQLRQSFWPGK